MAWAVLLCLCSWWRWCRGSRLWSLFLFSSVVASSLCFCHLVSLQTILCLSLSVSLSVTALPLFLDDDGAVGGGWEERWRCWWRCKGGSSPPSSVLPELPLSNKLSPLFSVPPLFRLASLFLQNFAPLVFLSFSKNRLPSLVLFSPLYL